MMQVKVQRQPYHRPLSQQPKKKLNRDDFMFKDRTNELLIKEPGQINGIEFRMKEIHDCVVYIFDHTALITIDKCTNTKFFIGPVAGSIFIRDCSDCEISVACSQFRSRNLYDSDVYLYAQNEPIIESSQGLKFAPYNLAYPFLDKHAKAAGLSKDQNKWNKIYDFTQVEDNYKAYMTMKNYDSREPNYSIMEPYDWKMNKIPLQNCDAKPVVAFRYPATYGGSVQDYASVYQENYYQNEEFDEDQIIEFDSSGSNKKKHFKKRRNSSPMRVTLVEDCSSKFTSYAETIEKVQQKDEYFNTYFNMRQIHMKLQQ